jgi:hypothetical protein
MKSYIWKGLIGVAFTGGLMALGAGVAYADNTTSGDDGTGSGSQAVIGLNLPITLGGSAISILGDSSNSGSTATPPASSGAPSGNTNGNVSLLGGTQALLDAHAPITVSGNAISVIGDSGSASSAVGSGSGSAAGATGSGGGTTSGDDSTLGGTQVLGDVSAPVNVTGNAISVAGDSSSTGSGTGSMAGQSATGSGSTDPAAGDSGSTTPGTTTSGDDGILGGTQVVPDVTAPVTATGNAISVIGDSSSSGAGGTGTVGGVDTGIPGVTTSGTDGILGGTQFAPVVSAPITIGGDAVSVIGDSTTTSGTPGGGGEVGGVDTFPPATGTTPAALSVASLAETGVPALSALALGILLLMAGIGVMVKAVALRH